MIKITVPHRARWYQLMDADLDNPEVGIRLRLIASRWWTRYRGAWTIVATATDTTTGETRTATAHAVDPYATEAFCPHCGGELSSNQSGPSSDGDNSRRS